MSNLKYKYDMYNDYDMRFNALMIATMKWEIVTHAKFKT